MLWSVVSPRAGRRPRGTMLEGYGGGVPWLRRRERGWPEVLRGVRHSPVDRVFGVRYAERAHGEVLRGVRRAPRWRGWAIRRPCQAGSNGSGHRASARHGPLRRPRRVHALRRGARCRGDARPPDPVLRSRPRDGRTLRGDRREVHRRRGHGRMGRSDSAGRRRGAGRSGGAGPGGRRAHPGTGPPGASRGPHGGGGRHDRRVGPGDGRRGPRQHGVTHPGRGRRGHGSRRRGDPPRSLGGHRVRNRPGCGCSRGRRSRYLRGERCASSRSGAAGGDPTCWRPRSSAATTSCTC